MKYKVNFEIELRKNPYKGLYIALEGIDGSGKTTQVEKLAAYFKSCGKDVITTREPRKVGLIGNLVQKILTGEERVPSVSIQYLFAADRASHHKELILPSLQKGKVIITDRCFWSAIVYGILDRTGGKYDKNDADLLLISQSILSMYHQFIVPDYTFYLKIPLKISLARLARKNDAKEIYEEEDKIKKVMTGYDYLQERFDKNIIIIDGQNSIDKVTQDIISHIKLK